MSNNELWNEEGMEEDNLMVNDYCWMFRGKWVNEFRTTDVVDREILTALGLHSKLRELHENTTREAKTFLRKLKKQMNIRMEHAVSQQNQRILNGLPQSRDNRQDDLDCNVRNINDLLKGVRIPQVKDQTVEAKRLITLLCAGRGFHEVAKIAYIIQQESGYAWMDQNLIRFQPKSDQKDLMGIISPPVGPPNGILTPNHMDWHVVNQELLQKWVHEIDGVPDSNNLHMLKKLYKKKKWNIRYTRQYLNSVVYRYQHFKSAETVEEVHGYENGEFPDGPEDLDSHMEYIERNYDEGFNCCKELMDYTLSVEKKLALRPMTVTTYQSLETWPHFDSDRSISFRIQFKEYNEEILKKQTVRMETGLEKLKPVMITTTEFAINSFAATLMGHLNLLGHVILDPLGTTFYRRISTTSEMNIFPDSDFIKCSPQAFPEDTPYEDVSGKCEPTLIETIFDSDLLITDTIVYSRSLEDGHVHKIRFPDSEPLTDIIVVLRKRSPFESMFVARTCRRIDPLAQMFEPRLRPLKMYSYQFCGPKFWRQTEKARKLFLVALLQTLEKDEKVYSREYPIKHERYEREKSDPSTRFIRQRSARQFMTFCLQNSLSITNIHEDALVRVNHLMSEESLESLNLHPHRQRDGLILPFSLDL